MGGWSERTPDQTKKAAWNTISYICTMALHSFISFAHCHAASIVFPLLPKSNLHTIHSTPPLSVIICNENIYFNSDYSWKTWIFTCMDFSNVNSSMVRETMSWTVSAPTLQSDRVFIGCCPSPPPDVAAVATADELLLLMPVPLLLLGPCCCCCWGCCCCCCWPVACCKLLLLLTPGTSVNEFRV